MNARWVVRWYSLENGDNLKQKSLTCPRRTTGRKDLMTGHGAVGLQGEGWGEKGIPGIILVNI